MARDRISLQNRDETDDEPFITTADHLKEQMDKSHMPESSDNPRPQPTSSDDTATAERTPRPSQRETTEQDDDTTQDAGPTDVEERAVKKAVERLKEKGMSDAFIEENMDTIRERVREELR